jgi:KDO2-lipid IV(A) lauroyltransferase
MVVLAEAVLARVPEAVATAVGSAMGWLAGSLLRIRRGTVDANLERAFPDRSPRWRSRVALATYRHFGREAVSLLRFRRMAAPEVRARTDVEGLEWLQGPISRGQGVIVLAGHFGNWEIAGTSATARGIRVDAVARRQANSLFDGYMEDVRADLGMGVVYREQAAREVLKRLRAAPQVVAIVADQNAGEAGVFVDFFGIPASTVRGPGVLALRAGAPVVFVDPRRLSGSSARYRIRFAPVQYEASGDLEEDVRRLTGAYMKSLEEAVREEPGQYFWFHKRWKTRPLPEDAPEPGSGRPVPGVARSAGGPAEPRGEEGE